MPEKTDLNIAPYYDDFSEDKKFQKVLFRAGRPLQSRELTQSQSILQNQIERFGSHMFEEGSLVTGAESDVDLDIFYVKVDSANPNSGGDASVEDYRTSFHGKFLRGKSSGVVGKVFESSAETSDDPITLFVKFHSQGTDEFNSIVFYSGEELQECTLGEDGTVTVNSANANEFTVKPKTDSPIGRSSIASISEGVVFARGFFCKVDAQTLILEKYSGKPTYRVGLNITESLLSSADDTSLLDNSSGTTNENAAGADRLKLDFTLSKFTLDTTDDTDFIELVRVNQGIIELKITRPIYNEIENTLARRTFDANGDFVVRQFTHSLREHLDDTTNRGYYTATNGGDTDKFVMQVSPGKAYVKGYEIDKIGTTPISISKARSTVSLDNTNTPVRIGNKLRITNVHSLPEFGNETGDATITPFKEVTIWDSTISSDGTEPTSGKIGFARLRNIDLQSGSASSQEYDASSTWNLYLFDIKMLTKLSGTLSGTFTEGDQVVGGTSGATGIVSYTASGQLYVHDVVGTFVVGDAITTNGTTSGTTTVTAVRNYNIDRARGVSQDPADAGSTIFTANVVVDGSKTLLGTVTFTNSSSSVTGFATSFTTELKEGDIIVNPANSNEELIVSSVTDDTTLTLTGNAGASYNGNVTRKRAKIYDQDQTASIFAWPRDWVKTHSCDSIQVRRQQVVDVSGGSFTITTGSNATFGAINTDNFTIAVVDESSDPSAYDLGDLLNIEDFTGDPTSDGGTGQTLTKSIANNDGAKLKVTFTVNRTNPNSRNKTLRQSRLLGVESARSAGGFYGTAYDDKEITLGVADVHKIHAIYEGVGGTTPLPPSSYFAVDSGTFQIYETIVGQTSDARAVLITYNGDLATSYYRIVSGTFTEGESVVGQTSNAVATITSVSQGSPDIKSRFFFDNGQRDGFYDLAKITRKVGEPVPSGKILIVFDYFTSDSGDFFDVESYTSIPYQDIPVYSPSRVDLGGLEPDGTFELSDAIDFRPVAGQIIGTSTFGTTNTQDPTNPVNLSDGTEGAVYAPFGYDTGRDFSSSRLGITSTGASANDTPVTGSSVVGDISFYVGRIDKVFLHKSGSFQTSAGIPALSPTKPKAIDDAIELFELQIPAYTKNLKNIRVRTQDHRRFTMKDIGKINNRVTNLERITALSLLERDTQTKQILDADGFDRFKSGFLVDNFRGHRVGDVNHPDYEISIDTKLGAMRPKSYSQFFDIEFNQSSSSNYQKTGDLITLPYNQVTYVNQDKASRTINVNPYHVFNFFGTVKLTPETDIWNDTEQLPEVRINREGNFDAVLAENQNSLGTVWNSWQTTWVGEPNVVSTEVQATSNGSWSGDPTQGGEWVAGLQVTREITETVETQTRTGVTTSVVEDFVETRNDRVVSISIVPFMRARTIEVDATNLKPNANHYFFFDGIRVDQYIRPFSATYSQDGGTTVSSNCKADGNGRLRAYFELPNDSKQRFPTGQRELRLTSSYYDLQNPGSQASGMYQAQGLLQSNQTEITSTRNGRVILERNNSTRQITRQGERINAQVFDADAPEVPTPELPPIVDIIQDPVVIPDPPPWIEQIVEPIIPPLPEPPPFVAEPVVIPATRRILEVPDRNFRDFRLERGWGDPLAQSFLVEKSGGIFVTSIDLFFEKKDTTLPVSVEIRNMVNGYPGQTVMPFSTVTKNPADVNTSTDGSSATTFTFDSPVYLEEDFEYAFVVYSNSNEYTAFISRMGEKDLKTSQTISGQPYAGSLFVSQNASTWTATQEDDLKFHMRNASFDVSKTPVLKFENKALPVSTLQTNPVETISGQQYVKVYNYMHGMYTTNSNVTIAGITGDKENGVLNIGTPSVSGTPSDGTYNVSLTGGSGTGATAEFTVASNVITTSYITDPGTGYATTDTLSAVNFDGGTADLTVGVDAVGDTLGGIPVSAINQTFTAIGNIEMDSFTVLPDISSFDVKTTYASNDSTVGGGENATSTRNYYFDTLHTLIPSLNYNMTRISASVLTTPMNSPEGYSSGTAYNKNNTSKFITLNDNVFFDSPSVVASPLNETNEMSSEKSFTCTLQLQSLNGNVSPVIDIGTIGAIGISNRINKIDSASDVQSGTVYTASTEPDGDNNTFIYCTRKVNLKTPASTLKVIADVFRPPTTEIEVLYKVLKNDESTPFDDLNWEYFNSDGNPDTTVEADARNFKEYEWTVDDLPEFSAFAVKIVGKGTNTSVVPMVSALRCLGLA